MRRRRLLRPALMALLMLVGGLYAGGSVDWCGRWPLQSPRLISAQVGEGTLRAGAARMALEPPYPVVVAGYGPPRPEVSQATAPLHARALVLESAGVRVGVVSVDLLSMPAVLVEQIRQAAASLRLEALWVVATHSHSSMGGYDRRLMAQVAGTGRYREQAVQAVVSASLGALQQASATMREAQMSMANAGVEHVGARSGPRADDRVTQVLFRAPDGTGIGQLVVLSAHPTLIPRRTAGVSPDYPGELASLEEQAGHGITLVMQAAAGNASVSGASGSEFSQKVHGALAAATAEVYGPAVRVGHSRVEVSLPRPDSQRLVPPWSRRVGDNFLCLNAPRVAEVSALSIGPLSLLGIPGEPTFAAGEELEQRSGAQRVLGLANGYLGYVETAEAVRARAGEARRQYYQEELLERLSEGAAVAAQALQGDALLGEPGPP